MTVAFIARTPVPPMCLGLHMNSRRARGPFYKGGIRGVSRPAEQSPLKQGVLRDPRGKTGSHAIGGGFIVMGQYRPERRFASKAADGDAVADREKQELLYRSPEAFPAKRGKDGKYDNAQQETGQNLGGSEFMRDVGTGRHLRVTHDVHAKLSQQTVCAGAERTCGTAADAVLRAKRLSCASRNADRIANGSAS